MHLTDLLELALKEIPQARFAAAVGVAQTTVSGWRRGVSVPPRPRLPALAAALGRPVEDVAAIVAADRAARMVAPVVDASSMGAAPEGSCPEHVAAPVGVAQ